MERYLAIDNVCAWPNLTLMPNGEIIATIFNQPCHGRWEGEVECWVSRDGGCMWSKRGVPAPHVPGTNRMNVSAGLACSGDLVVIASGWSNIPTQGSPVTREPHGFHTKCGTLDPWVCRSADGGQTWTHTDNVTSPTEHPPVGFGDITALPDGSLATSMYAKYGTGPKKGAGRRNAYLLRSTDDGHSWGDGSLIAEDHSETDILVVDDQRMLAASRTDKTGHLDLYASEDCGRTWRLEQQLTSDHQHPSHLIKLADGRILVTYGIRYLGFYGIGARLSEDGGRYWYRPMVLANLDNAYDGGYPSTVQLADGNLVTAFYASGVAAHNRYHMGVIRWQVEEVITRNREPVWDV